MVETAALKHLGIDKKQTIGKKISNYDGKLLFVKLD